MSTNEVRSNNVTAKATAAKMDMKFEIVVIPVSDVDRAKEFYGRLGWRLDADYDNGDDFRVIQFTPPGSGCSVIFGKNVTAAAPGSAQGLYLIVSDIEAARDELARVAASDAARCSTTPAACTLARTSPTCLGGSGSAVRIPSIAATARSSRSAIPTATAGCCRRSRRGCPVASTPRRQPSRRRTIWRARFGVQKPPTDSTKSASGRDATRTGRTGTPRTWWRSRLGRSCRSERLCRHRAATRQKVTCDLLKGGASCRGISMPSLSGPARQARLWLRGLRPRA